jgi:hypothetical protein
MTGSQDGPHMLANLALNRVFISVCVLAAVFFGLLAYVPPVPLIVGLNGLFVGCMVAVMVAYHRLIAGAWFGIGEYNRVRQMTLGFAVLWVAIFVGAANSIYLRSAGVDVPTTPLTAATRYLAVIAAVLQVTAPDFGLGLFHGRDRRVLWAAGLSGLVSAVATIFLQWQAFNF